MRTVPAPHGARLPWVGTRQGSASCTVGLRSFVFFDILPPLSPVPTYLSQKAYPTACLRAPPPRSLTATTGQCHPPPRVGITCSEHCLFTPVNPGEPLVLPTLPCSPRSIPHPFTTAPGPCCALPAHAVDQKQSQWFAACGRSGVTGAGRAAHQHQLCLLGCFHWGLYPIVG